MLLILIYMFLNVNTHINIILEFMSFYCFFVGHNLQVGLRWPIIRFVLLV